MANLNDVADFFVESAVKKNSEPMTNLRLQKMVYYAQAWHLQRHGVPLFDVPITKLPLGPVIDPLYQQYKKYVARPITKIHSSYDVAHFTLDELTTLVDVFHEYNQYTTPTLVNWSHRKCEPWSKFEVGQVISLDQIKKDFDALPRLKSIDEDPSLYDGIPVVDCLPREYYDAEA